MKNKLLLLMLMASLSVSAQKGNYDQLIMRQSFQLKNKVVKDVQTDTAFVTNEKLPSSLAVSDFVRGRIVKAKDTVKAGYLIKIDTPCLGCKPRINVDSPALATLIGGGGTPGWALTGNAGTSPSTKFVGTTDNVGLSFRTNNIPHLRLTPYGYFGIGTNNPVADLHISGDQVAAIRLQANGIYGGDGILNTFGIYDRYGANLYEIASVYDSTNPSIRANTHTSYLPLTISTASTDPISFQTNSTTRLTILPNGNVGVGTPTPGYAFDVVGDVNITGDFMVNGTPIGGGSTIYTGNGTLSAHRTIDGNNKNLEINNLSGLTFKTDGFGIYNQSGSFNLIELSNSGNFNIKGDVFGDQSFTGTTLGVTPYGEATFKSYDSTDPGGSYRTRMIIRGLTTNANIEFPLVGKLFIDNDTHEALVGINNTSPTAALDVTGSIKATGNIEVSDHSKGFIIQSPDNTRWLIAVDNSGALSAIAAP